MYRKLLMSLPCILVIVLASERLLADAWVLEPSIKLDVGFDDNNGMDVVDPQEVGVTKITGELGLRRLSQTHFFKGAILVDAVNYQGDETIESNSNQVLYFSTSFNKPRSRWGANFNYRRDSLIREADADDNDIEGGDFGDENPDATVDQFLDIARQRLYLNPFYKNNLSRRSDLALNYRLSAVEHDRTEDDAGNSFNLQNFNNQGVTAAIGYKLTPLDKIIGKTTFDAYSTEEGSNEYNTVSVRVGYERSISPTFTVGGELGYRVTDFVEDNEDITKEGMVGSLSGVKTTGLTKFELRGGVALYPSSIGQVVQTQELVANVTRNLSQLMVFSFRSRAYENTALSGSTNNDRRSIEMRPEIRWQFSREWSLGAAYRYRREKLESKPTFAEGNALLFSVKYTKLSPLTN